MNVAIVGCRTSKDYKFFKNNLPDLNITRIISGGSSGIDSLAKRYALEENIEYMEFLPDWNTHGLAAGPIRNKKIVDAAEYMVAFWDGKSKGTKSAIKLAKQKGIPVEIVMFKF